MKQIISFFLSIFLYTFVHAGTSSANVVNAKIKPTPSKSKGMVAAANPLASRAGVEILEAGGSAIDAAIAIQAMLGLVEPQSSGLGGGAFMVVYDPKTAKVWSYNGREKAPGAASPDMFLDPQTKQPIPYRNGIASGVSTGVPGVITMLQKAHQDYGLLDWGVQFEPAIKTAENGFKVSPRMANITARMGGFALNKDKNAKDYFFLDDGNKTIPVGFLRDNPQYANTLRALQKNPRALLEGPIAQEILRVTHRPPFPGSLTLDDMKNYQAKKTEALCSTYRSNIICGAQPPSSGPVAVQSILGVLENFDMKKLGMTSEGWHIFSEASFLAYADRDKYIGDPDFITVDADSLIDKEYLRSRADLIRNDIAMKNVTAGNPNALVRGKDSTPDNPSTSHFTVVDKDGLVVSMTTTVEAAFGSQRMAAGFILNNQLTDFSFQPRDSDGLLVANAVGPNKRPRSSMAPVIVFNPEGEFLFTSGSPGGSSIIAYTAKTIVGILDWGLSPQDAIELPNVIARNGRVAVEAKGLKDEISGEIDRGSPAEEFGLPESLIKGLESRGHKVRRSKGEFSGIHIIYRDEDGTLIGGADPRREGVALGLD
ncbi:MAG: gamma-glutamyltransferase [Hellea sp.]|jgi:gamma-glutamyltranspeptidase/glutathione hydrolase|nr:gamma-glutamyltransferase [Hellea sp.]